MDTEKTNLPLLYKGYSISTEDNRFFGIRSKNRFDEAYDAHFLSIYDLSGSLIHKDTAPLVFGNHSPLEIYVQKNNGIYIIGLDNGNDGNARWIKKINFNGKTLWSKKLPGSSDVKSVSFSKENKFLVVMSGNYFSTNKKDTQITVFSVEDGITIKDINTKDLFHKVYFTQDNNLIAISNKKIREYSIKDDTTKAYSIPDKLERAIAQAYNSQTNQILFYNSRDDSIEIFEKKLSGFKIVKSISTKGQVLIHSSFNDDNSIEIISK